MLTITKSIELPKLRSTAPWSCSCLAPVLFPTVCSTKEPRQGLQRRPQRARNRLRRKLPISDRITTCCTRRLPSCPCPLRLRRRTPRSSSHRDPRLTRIPIRQRSWILFHRTIMVCCRAAMRRRRRATTSLQARCSTKVPARSHCQRTRTFCPHFILLFGDTVSRRLQPLNRTHLSRNSAEVTEAESFRVRSGYAACTVEIPHTSESVQCAFPVRSRIFITLLKHGSVGTLSCARISQRGARPPW